MAKVYITYNNEEIQDGYFAQLQRQMAIYSIAKKYRFSYFHSKIIKIIPTQLDSFQSDIEIQKFLNEYNQKYTLISTNENVEFNKIIDVSIPTIKTLIFLRFKFLFRKYNLLIRITNPHRIMEKIHEYYKISADQLVNDLSKTEFQENLIVVHIRRGVAMTHVVPGETNVRWLTDQYFIDVVRKILEESKNSEKMNMVILTDAPEIDIHYKPISENANKWVEFDRYKDEDKGLIVQGHQFENIKEYFDTDIRIVRGGDLDFALNLMRTAGHFIMSRSSMSYVGALLNSEGKIYYPPDFWHKPMKGWIKA
jgi:hypothetical protein